MSSTSRRDRATSRSRRPRAAPSRPDVDFSDPMLAYARAHAPGIEFVRGDATALPFDDESFDAVVAAFLLLHLGAPEHAVAEAARVLRPGGRAAFSVWDVPARGRWVGVFFEAVLAAGAQPPQELPIGPPFFRLADDAEFRSVLEGAGLGEVTVGDRRVRPRPRRRRRALGRADPGLRARRPDDPRADGGGPARDSQAVTTRSSRRIAPRTGSTCPSRSSSLPERRRDRLGRPGPARRVGESSDRHAELHGVGAGDGRAHARDVPRHGAPGAVAAGGGRTRERPRDSRGNGRWAEPHVQRPRRHVVLGP